ncbi:MAG: 16S rRNA (guanine(527)-N(7))-methyltransferase RsmG, partial [Clostridia bacterium]|nr:16S rRNA (guanine(527)-N(7))-methyltransferase RsmG [Clostridia bacterium]
MNFTDFYRLYCDIFRQNSLDRFCDEETAHHFFHFTELLIEENSHTNLTAIREIPDIISKHYADCLLAESHFPSHAKVLDMGCGGGFPTIPLAIVRPDLSITAVDSTRKKINFVQKAVDHLKSHNVTPLCARAESEELRKYYETFDVATSRAMARLSVLSELTLPFVRVNGELIALKGTKAQEEIKEAHNAIRILGG